MTSGSAATVGPSGLQPTTRRPHWKRLPAAVLGMALVVVVTATSARFDGPPLEGASTANHSAADTHLRQGTPDGTRLADAWPATSQADRMPLDQHERHPTLSSSWPALPLDDQEIPDTGCRPQTIESATCPDGLPVDSYPDYRAVVP